MNCYICKKNKEIQAFYKEKVPIQINRRMCLDCARKKKKQASKRYQDARKNNPEYKKKVLVACKKSRDKLKNHLDNNPLLKQKYRDRQNKYKVDSRQYRISRLILFKEEIGCQHCGFNVCGQALDFHHVDPKTKSFNISMGISHPSDQILQEVAKCCVLCANCHRMFHVGLIDELPSAIGDKAFSIHLAKR